MTLDYMILISVIILSCLLAFFIPRNKIRLALLAFMTKQGLTYLLGLVAVELNLLEYPVRFLADINRTSFTYEYLAYPMICAVLITHYPDHRSRWYQFGYYAAFCSISTIIEIWLEKNTNLIRYLHWNWFWTWSMLGITCFLAQRFCAWFFKRTRNPSREAEPVPE